MSVAHRSLDSERSHFRASSIMSSPVRCPQILISLLTCPTWPNNKPNKAQSQRQWMEQSKFIPLGSGLGATYASCTRWTLERFQQTEIQGRTSRLTRLADQLPLQAFRGMPKSPAPQQRRHIPSAAAAEGRLSTAKRPPLRIQAIRLPIAAPDGSIAQWSPTSVAEAISSAAARASRASTSAFDSSSPPHPSTSSLRG